jgi:hypothetical protein
VGQEGLFPSSHFPSSYSVVPIYFPLYVTPTVYYVIYANEGGKYDKVIKKTLNPRHIFYASQNSPQATTFSYTKQYSNQSGSKEYNSGVRLPTQM